MQISATKAADLVLIPVQPSAYDIWSSETVVESEQGVHRGEDPDQAFRPSDLFNQAPDHNIRRLTTTTVAPDPGSRPRRPLKARPVYLPRSHQPDPDRRRRAHRATTSRSPGTQRGSEETAHESRTDFTASAPGPAGCARGLRIDNCFILL